MKVKDLIKQLNELPQDAEIGTFNADDCCIYKEVPIYTKKDKVCCSYNDNSLITISEIEDGRLSNKDRICDLLDNLFYRKVKTEQLKIN